MILLHIFFIFKEHILFSLKARTKHGNGLKIGLKQIPEAQLHT